jgi:hypothetical protein
MPKIITPAMRAHLDAETTRLAAIWRITHKDGQQFFFTDYDRDIVFGGEVYRADAGFARTAIRSDAGFAVDNLDLVGVFAEGGIVEDEVRAVLFDGAEIAISFVNWQDPDGHGEIRLRRGTLMPSRSSLLRFSRSTPIKAPISSAVAKSQMTPTSKASGMPDDLHACGQPEKAARKRHQVADRTPFRVTADGLNRRAGALSAASTSPSTAASCGVEARASG